MSTTPPRGPVTPSSKTPTLLASSSVESDAAQAIVEGRHGDPFSLLGPHQVSLAGESGVAVRVFAPTSEAAWVVSDTATIPMTRLHSDGVFEAFFPGATGPFPYRLRLRNDLGVDYETADPYAFASFLSDYDLHLLGEGTHYHNYERLGAHLREIDGVRGVSFAVWAPNAKRVSVVGDFNQWDGRRHPMRLHPGVGVWDIFIPGLTAGDKYKFELLGPDGKLLPLKSDPYGFYHELRPATAAIVHDINQYQWNDAAWMARRDPAGFLREPISVYEVHLGSWMRGVDQPESFFSYRELAERLVAHVKELGFTHLELMPVTEHPFDGSWGYQTLGYYAPTSRYGEPEDFMAFVDYCHQQGIGVIVDWVPAHFPRDDHGLRMFDGTCLYEHADPRKGEHPDWGTQVFNYGRNEVSNFLIGNALFWLEKYHIDGLRVDAVASMLYLDYGRRDGEWIPNQYGGNENLEAIDFIKKLNEIVHARHPGILMFAEESTAWPAVSRPVYLGGLGFDIKWNMGWMNDTLRYMHRDPIYRKFHQNDLTFSLVYAFSENFVLPLSHDEVVHGKGSLLDKMPGDLKQRFANLRLLFGVMYAHPGKKLLFMGAEFAQWQEWRYYQSLDWHLLEWETHQGVMAFVRDLNRLLKDEPALHELDFDAAGFQWVDLHDHESSTLSFLRKGKDPDQFVLFCCNFTPVARDGYRVGVPRGGYYREILNSDSSLYDGSNVGNAGGLPAEEHAWHDMPYSLVVTLPPLGIVCFKPQ